MKGLAPLMKALMSGDQQALVNYAKPYMPEVLEAALTGIIVGAGGDPETDGAYLWHYKRNGTVTVMATVYKRTPLDEPGEVVATVNVNDLAANLDLKTVTKNE